jgi:hypothetical protein
MMQINRLLKASNNYQKLFDARQAPGCLLSTAWGCARKG